MHQILTDLNRKMEEINEKSTAYREKLQKCVEELGNVASKKIFDIFNSAEKSLERVFFTRGQRASIRRIYKEYLVDRLAYRVEQYFCQISMKKMVAFAKDSHKEKVIEKRLKVFDKKTEKRLVRNTFDWIRTCLKNHKKAFARLIHV